jgi:hypothetical protein
MSISKDCACNLAAGGTGAAGPSFLNRFKLVLQRVAYDVTNLSESTTDCNRTEKKLIASIGFKDQIEVSRYSSLHG